MNPLRLRAEHFRGYEHLDLDLPDGCCAIVGSNGSGKSSIVEGLDIALFGSRALGSYLSEGGASTEMELELTFEHAGETYRVRRSYSSRGRGKTTCDLEVHREGVMEMEVRDNGQPHPGEEVAWWQPLTRGSQQETQALLEQILGLSRRTLCASSILKQGDGDSFTSADPRDRKAILAEVLGLDRFDRYLQLTRADKHTAEIEVQQIAGALDSAATELRDRDLVTVNLRAAEAQILDATRELEQQEQRAAEIAARLQTITEKRALLQAAAAEWNAAGERLALLEGKALAAENARRQLAICEEELAELPTLTQLQALELRETDLRAEVEAFTIAVTAHEQAKRERELKQTQRDAIKARARELGDEALADIARADQLEQRGPGVDTCDNCGQTLGAEALASTLASLRTHADELAAAAADLAQQAAAVELPTVPPPPDGEPPVIELQQAAIALRTAREQAVQHARLTERITGLKVTIAAAPPTTELYAGSVNVVESKARVDELHAQLPTDTEIRALEGHQAAARQRITDERARLDNAKAEQAKEQEQLRRLDELERRSAEQRKRQAELHGELDILTVLEKAYGRDGIPALIVENAAIPQIEVEANRILGELGTTFRVELRTERALKSGDGTRDTLDVVIATDAGERPYETFSGGERTRINLALRIALARLLATRRGAESKVLIIDEPEFLDEPGTAALADVLRILTEFDRVILVSHVPSLRDAFEQTIEITKDEQGRSSIVGALEAVPV